MADVSVSHVKAIIADAERQGVQATSKKRFIESGNNGVNHMTRDV